MLFRSAIFGVKCVDFVTAWEFAERYTKAISTPEIGNDRFLTIIPKGNTCSGKMTLSC